MENAARALLLVVVLGTALALGALHTEVLAVATLLLAVAAALAWWRAPSVALRQPAGVLLVIGGALIAFTALQLVPLPMGVLRVIAGTNAAIWMNARAAVGAPLADAAPIALDPPAARIEILRGVAYLLAFVTGLRLAQRGRAVPALEVALGIASLCVALAALAHPLVGANKVFGFYRPVTMDFGRHLAPLLNPNHLAAYINIGVCCLAATALSRRPILHRGLVGVLALLAVAAQLWVASRGGLAAMALGIALVAWMSFGYAPRAHRTRLLSLVIPAALAVTGLALAVLSTSESAYGEVASLDTSKMGLAKQALSAATHFSWVGMGRGAFESVFPRFREGVGHATFTHPENIVAQWAAEWGLPVAVGALVACASALRPATVLVRSHAPVGAWAALAVVAVHNVVDFSSEVPAVAIALAVCAAMVVAGARAPGSHAVVLHGRPVAVGSVALAVGAAAFALGVRDRDLHSDRVRMQRAALDPSLDDAAFDAELRGAMLRHPSEPFLTYVAAARAVRTRSDDPRGWIEETLARAPVYPPAHLLLARVIARQDPVRSRAEYRIALAQEPSQAFAVVREAAARVTTYDAAAQLVPESPAARSVLGQLAADLTERLPATSFLLHEELQRRFPVAPEPAMRVAADAREDVLARELSPWCDEDRVACVATAERLARRAIAAQPYKCEGHGYLASVLVASGRAEEGYRVLDGAVDQVEDRQACLRQLVDVARRSGSERVESLALERLARAGCATPKECAHNLGVVRTEEERRGNPHRAVALLKQQYELVPDRDYLVELVNRAGKLGMHSDALDACQKLAGEEPDEPRWAACIRAERDEIGQGLLRRTTHLR